MPLVMPFVMPVVQVDVDTPVVILLMRDRAPGNPLADSIRANAENLSRLRHRVPLRPRRVLLRHALRPALIMPAVFGILPSPEALALVRSHPSARSGSIFGNGQVLVMRIVEDQAYSLSQLVSCEQPLGLHRVEPRTLLGQKAAYDPHSLATVFGLTVVRGNPLCDLPGDVPGSVVPDQNPYPLARRLKLLAAPRKEAGGYGAHGPPIHEAHPYLLKLRHIEPVAGDSLRIGVILGERLFDEAQGLSCIAPTAQSRSPARRLNQVFSCILRIWGSDPAFGPLPAYSQARQSSPDGLPADPLLGQPLLEAYFGNEIQRPQTRVFAELPGFVVQKLPQGLGLFGTLEGPVNGMRTFGALPKCLRKSLLVESVYGVAGSLRIASQLVSDLVGVFASGAGEQDLAAAQGEGIRRTQACLQGLALGVTQGTHKDRSFHTSEDKP